MFKSNLKALKIGKNVSWKTISAATGISEGSLTRIAANKGAWTTNTRHLDSLCRYFGCGLDDLLEFEPRLGRESSVHIDDLYPSGRRRPRPVATATATVGKAGPPARPKGSSRAPKRRTP